MELQLQFGQGIAQQHSAAVALPLGLVLATAGESAVHQVLKDFHKPEQQIVAAAVLVFGTFFKT